MSNRPNLSALLPLFFVSLAAIAFEILLTRYFAIANWSEYGYWVISITMAGFASSGVMLSLFKDWCEPRARQILFITPGLLIAAAALGFHWVTINPFNPLELQNPLLWQGQLLNIGKYYLALFPYFFLTGLYIGLYFLMYQRDIPRVYAADLAGAGLGALAILALMVWVHPFYLLPGVMVVLAAVQLGSILTLPAGRKLLPALLLAVIFLAGEGLAIRFNQADFNEYKIIYPALHVENNRVVTELKSPRGYYLLLDNFTERLDTDFSNNFGLLGVSEPPATLGLYKDGNRITSLPKSIDFPGDYVQAALDSGPYLLLDQPRTLLIGTRGGFRIRESLDLGAGQVVALEPDPILFRLIGQGHDGVRHPSLSDPRVTLLDSSPAELAISQFEPFDLIDLSSDFLGQSVSNKYAFTVEAMGSYLDMLTPEGLVSIPVNIREFTLYALKMIETARQALLRAGVADPRGHLIVYRSAWNVRILIFKTPLNRERIGKLLRFCDDRSFDTSFFPGIDPSQVEVWNDLPLVSFASGQVLSRPNEASDAVRAQALELLGADPEGFLENHFFNLRPPTHDRPFFHSILDLKKLGAILNNIALIPREEIGYLVNVAVLSQSILLALVVLLLPLIRWRKRLPERSVIGKGIFYFAGLGFGFLFLEILMIEKASFFLNDFTSAFAVVLAAMLVFSGIGSYLSGYWLPAPGRGVRIAGLVVLVWCALAYVLLDPLLFALLHLPFGVKCVVLTMLLAPVSIALGFPFPLGLSVFGGSRSNFLPWAWSLNGAFSVISTPLANLLAISEGYSLLLVAGGALYLMVLILYPAPKGWHGLPRGTA